jgi:hypothetical protein
MLEGLEKLKQIQKELQDKQTAIEEIKKLTKQVDELHKRHVDEKEKMNSGNTQ